VHGRQCISENILGDVTRVTNASEKKKDFCSQWVSCVSEDFAEDVEVIAIGCAEEELLPKIVASNSRRTI